MANQYQSEMGAQRKAAIAILAQGLATVAELARHWNLPRQTVARWARGIDVAGARERAVHGVVARQFLTQNDLPRRGRAAKIRPLD